MGLILLNINVEVRKNSQSDFRPTTTENNDQFKVFLTGKSLHKTEDVVSLKKKERSLVLHYGKEKYFSADQRPPNVGSFGPPGPQRSLN